jgi:hypothetical protein
MRLRKLAAAAVLLLAAMPAAATAPAAATSARATEAGYLAAQRDIQRGGYWGSHPNISDGEIVSIGLSACTWITRGLSDAAVVRMQAPASLVPTGTRQYEAALQAVRDARRHLCP